MSYRLLFFRNRLRYGDTRTIESFCPDDSLLWVRLHYVDAPGKSCVVIVVDNYFTELIIVHKLAEVESKRHRGRNDNMYGLDIPLSHYFLYIGFKTIRIRTDFMIGIEEIHTIVIFINLYPITVHRFIRVHCKQIFLYNRVGC